MAHAQGCPLIWAGLRCKPLFMFTAHAGGQGSIYTLTGCIWAGRIQARLPILPNDRKDSSMANGERLEADMTMAAVAGLATYSTDLLHRRLFELVSTCTGGGWADMAMVAKRMARNGQGRGLPEWLLTEKAMASLLLFLDYTRLVGSVTDPKNPEGALLAKGVEITLGRNGKRSVRMLAHHSRRKDGTRQRPVASVWTRSAKAGDNDAGRHGLLVVFK